MSTNQWSLSNEEGARLIYYFLSGCCIATMQALSDTLGIEEAVRLWEPYNLLARNAYYQNRIEENRFPRLLDNGEPLLTIGVFFQHFFRAIQGGKCGEMIVTDRSLAFSISDIQPADMPPEIGRLFGAPPKFSQVIDPSYQEERSETEPGHILFLVKRKDDSTTTYGNEGTPRFCILPLRIDDNEIDFWKRHFWAEFWRQGASMLVEEFGEARASQIIEPYMRQIGEFYGDFFNNRFRFEERSPQEVANVILLLNRLLKEEGDLEKQAGDGVSCQITSCPFSNSSPFVCRQMAMICNSVCQAINKDLLFEYDNGLMKGEKACRWSIRKRRGG